MRLFNMLSLAAFVSSLCCRCYETNGNSTDTIGLSILLLGWMSIVGAEIAWLANPLWLLAIVLLFSVRKYEADEHRMAKLVGGLFLSVFATVCALSFYFQHSTLGGSGPAGTQFEITAYLHGYYLWLAAPILLFFDSTTQLVMGARGGTAD